MPNAPTWVFLDLDNTLWDFEANAEEALGELFHRHHLHLKSSFGVRDFIELYKTINKEYWKKYESGEIDKHRLRTERFIETFKQMGIPEQEHPENIWEEYLNICPAMTRLMPWAMGFLEFLKPNAQLALITNGFDKTQSVKISNSGILPYTQFMITSESLGIAKPDVRIFNAALQKANSKAQDCIYVGDTLDTDVRGALNAEIPVIWYQTTPSEVPADIRSNPLFLGAYSSLLEISARLTELYKWV